MTTFNEELKYVAYTQHHYTEVEPWCQVNIGVWNDTWYKLGDDIALQGIDPEYRSTYFFKTKQNQMLFMLKWG
jgi:hypothetical protein